MQLTKSTKTKKVTVRSCICLFTTCMNFPVNSTVVIHFKAALLQKYFTLVQTEKTSFFSFKAKDKNVMLYRCNSILDNKNRCR